MYLSRNGRNRGISGSVTNRRLINLGFTVTSILLAMILITSAKTNVSLAVLYAYSYDPQVLGAPLVAFDDIKSEQILPDFNIHWKLYDVYGDQFYATKIIVDARQSAEGLHAMIGILVSGVCQSIALEAAAWNIPFVSYYCQSQFLSNKVLYPTFFRTCGQLLFTSPLYLRFLLDNDWKRVAVLTVYDEIWLGLLQNMQQVLESNQITVISHVINKVYDDPTDMFYERPNKNNLQALEYVIESLKSEARSKSRSLPYLKCGN